MTHSSFQYIYTNVYSVAATSKQAYNRSSWFRVLLAAYADVCVRDTRRSIIPPSPTTSQRCVSLQTYAVRLLPYISMNNLIICWFMHES